MPSHFIVFIILKMAELLMSQPRLLVNMQLKINVNIVSRNKKVHKKSKDNTVTGLLHVNTCQTISFLVGLMFLSPLILLTPTCLSSFTITSSIIVLAYFFEGFLLDGSILIVKLSSLRYIRPLLICWNTMNCSNVLNLSNREN